MSRLLLVQYRFPSGWSCKYSCWLQLCLKLCYPVQKLSLSLTACKPIKLEPWDGCSHANCIHCFPHRLVKICMGTQLPTQPNCHPTITLNTQSQCARCSPAHSAQQIHEYVTLAEQWCTGDAARTSYQPSAGGGYPNRGSTGSHLYANQC